MEDWSNTGYGAAGAHGYWGEQAAGSAWGLSNVLINASYSPITALTFDIGYDNRKQVRTYESQDISDSLFDEALRQGFRAGISAQAPLGLRVWLRATSTRPPMANFIGEIPLTSIVLG